VLAADLHEIGARPNLLYDSVAYHRTSAANDLGCPWQVAERPWWVAL
jgi:hypothetical protein